MKPLVMSPVLGPVGPAVSAGATTADGWGVAAMTGGGGSVVTTVSARATDSQPAEAANAPNPMTRTMFLMTILLGGARIVCPRSPVCVDVLATPMPIPFEGHLRKGTCLANSDSGRRTACSGYS